MVQQAMYVLKQNCNDWCFIYQLYVVVMPQYEIMYVMIIMICLINKLNMLIC